MTILFPTGMSFYRPNLIITPFVAPGLADYRAPPAYKEGDEIEVLFGDLGCDLAEMAQDLAELVGEEAEDVPEECKPRVRNGWELGLGLDITVKKIGVGVLWMNTSGVFVKIGARFPISLI